jgi:hypothetical protein
MGIENIIYDQEGNVISGGLESVPIKADANVERKTTPSTASSTSTNQASTINFSSAAGKNVLNSYRSYTYNFTIAALTPDAAAKPEEYRNGSLGLVVLKSGGKGTGSMTPSIKNDSTATQSAQSNIGGFNQDSPGRFDMFIDNVEINSLLMPSQAGGVSQATGIKFEIVEPYSINGFLEAIHTSAVAAGYPSYMGAKFVLLVEFQGYPDNADLPIPEKIDKSSRYFPFIFSKVEIEVTERGTVYKVEATPQGDRAMGSPNLLKEPINMAGKTIKEILTNLMDKLNLQKASSDKNTKAKPDTKHDIYEIKFPSWDPDKGLDYNVENKIASSEVIELLKDSAVYKFDNPGSTPKTNNYKTKDQPSSSPEQQSKAPESIKYNPFNSSGQVHFSENTNVHDVISSVIRDSEYLKKILKDVKGNIDQYGMLDYFMVKIDVADLDEVDEVTKKHFEKFTYIVHPFKIHYTKIPGYESLAIDSKELQQKVTREYNYIYTGKNVDILNFKLQFDNLYFEGVGKSGGNSDQPERRDAAASSGTPNAKINSENKEKIEATQTPPPVTKTNPDLTQTRVGNTPNAGQRQVDTYSSMAKSLHEAVINSKVALTKGDIEIIGDPFYLVTGGIGNYNPKPDPQKKGVTADGEAFASQGEVLIGITFNNPIDYKTLPDGGVMYFDPKKVPFGGVYKITKVSSRFHDGQFKQVLEIIRQPGQYLDTQIQPSDVAQQIIQTPNASNQESTVDSTAAGGALQASGTAGAAQAGVRPDAANLQEITNRSLPNPGLPGEASNFTQSPGGLGGSSKNLLPQVSGAVTNGIGKQTLGASVFGGAIPGGANQLASGIRLQSSGIIGLAQSALGPTGISLLGYALNHNVSLGTVGGVLAGRQASQILSNIPGLPPLTQAIASNYIAQASANAINKATGVQGSGIGVGARVKFNPYASAAVTILREGSRIFSTPGPTVASENQRYSTVPPTAGAASYLGVSRQFNTPVNLGGLVPIQYQATAGLAINAAGKIAGVLNGTSADPSGAIKSLGIDAIQLSGLSPSLKNKVFQDISLISKLIPGNVNLQTSVNQGVYLNNMPSSKYPNIPSTYPYATAPNVMPDIAYQGTTPNITNMNQGTTVMPGLGQPNLADASSQRGLLQTAQTQLGGLTGVSGSVESNQSSISNILGNPYAIGLATTVVAQFGSKSAGSPLRKLFGL